MSIILFLSIFFFASTVLLWWADRPSAHPAPTKPTEPSDHVFCHLVHGEHIVPITDVSFHDGRIFLAGVIHVNRNCTVSTGDAMSVLGTDMEQVIHRPARDGEDIALFPGSVRFTQDFSWELADDFR